MEAVKLCQKESVMNVLTQGMELANELKRKLPPSRDACDGLVENILSSYENALTLLTLIGNSDSAQFTVNNLFESPKGSPRSEGSEQSCKDQVQNLKKRKTLPRWSEHIRVSSEKGSEGQFDGYSWRKYGQKDILGASHPRAYYRCTHRNTQGCLATKQVQRADDDASMFEIVYKGKHSCRQERVGEKKEKREKQRLVIQPQENRKIENQELDPKIKRFPSFAFPSAPIESENIESPFFSEPSNFIGTSCSSPFLSPVTSESFFSFSPCSANDFGISDSDFGEIVSNPTTIVTNFTFGDLDFLVNLDEFE